MSILIKPEHICVEEYEHLGLGSFRSCYKIPRGTSHLSEYEGKVVKFPTKSNPDSVLSNKLEYYFHENVPTKIRDNLANIIDYNPQYNYIIMEYIEDSGENISVPNSLKSRIRESATPCLSTQSSLDLTRDNFRKDNGKYKIIDYHFGLKE